jgi:hypothetical protein
MSKQFIAVFLFAAILGSYAFPESRLVPDDEFEWPSATELVQEEGKSDFVTMVEQNPTFKKAVSTIMKHDSKAGHFIHTMMLSAANKKVKFPRYFKSGVSWKNPKFKDYMLNGPIAQAITAIPGLTAYVCPVSGHEVSKWLKFDNAKALSAFKAWGPKQFNPKTMFTPHLKKVCSLKDGGFLKQPKCDFVAWVLGGAKFTTVPGKPRKDQVPISRSQYVAAKANPKCVHCTPHSPCYRSNYTKKHTAFVKKHKNKNYKKKGKEMESLATLLKTMSAEVLKNYGDHRKRTIERKKHLDLELKVITTEQFGKVAAKAHAWCGKWEDQQKDKKTEADKLSARNSAREQTATVKWNSDATGGLDCDYIDSTTGKPHTGNRKTTCNAKTFSPTNSFLTKWNNARNDYLRKDKSYYDARQKHIGSIQKSNDAAKGFKDGIDELVDVKIGECKVQKKVGVLKDVREFNQHNAKLANFFRSIEVIKCHVQSIDKTHSSKNLKNSALNTCIDGLDSVADLQRKKFKNITEPTKFCPTKKEYRDKLKLKHGLDLHYTGKTNAIVTDTQGVVSTKNGWYPRTKQCADVKKHAAAPPPPPVDFLPTCSGTTSTMTLGPGLVEYKVNRNQWAGVKSAKKLPMDTGDGGGFCATWHASPARRAKGEWSGNPAFIGLARDRDTPNYCNQNEKYYGIVINAHDGKWTLRQQVSKNQGVPTLLYGTNKPETLGEGASICMFVKKPRADAKYSWTGEITVWLKNKYSNRKFKNVLTIPGSKITSLAWKENTNNRVQIAMAGGAMYKGNKFYNIKFINQKPA